MRLTDACRPQGHVTLITRRLGKIELVDPHPNLIFDHGRTTMARLWAGTSTLRPTRIVVGTGTAASVPSGAVIANPVTRVLAACLGPMDDIPPPWDNLPGVPFPGPTTARFCFEIPEEAGNGLAIAEYALASDDGKLLARWTRSPIPKEADLAILGVWDIIF